ncbi:MAG: peptide chain release factor N(5)-glutamine methyltransferase [Holosporales bacterium]|jgi:release factor glutamine methyltransferase|nr:peptide chain release factor N(5)-glutamine methyltransferase [Holosporales bacterium]
MILSRADIIALSNSHSVSEKDALYLLAFVLNLSYTSVFFERNLNIPNDKYNIFLKFLERRSVGEPLAKIIEKKEFYGIEFKTTKNTLDPRPESELLVDTFRRYFPDENACLEILDLGSGTGCIGLSILTFYKASKCLFVDIDEDALAIATQNAESLGLSQRSQFVISNWFSNIIGRFDVIVSNPPYVAEDYELTGGAVFDPKISLFAGKDGMEAIHSILMDAPSFLKSDGKLILEIGFDQRAKLQLLQTSLRLEEILKDLSGHDRGAVFLKTGN